MSSASRPRLRRLSWTPAVSSSGEMAGCHDLSGGRRRSELGDDHQPCRVRVQGLPDDLVGDVRAVVVGRVDMVHAGRDGLAEDGDGTVRVLGRPPHAGAGQLHRAVAYPLDCQ